jgi:hypothetical protein
MKQLFLPLILIVFSHFLHAQAVGINTTTPHPSAIFDVVSTLKGTLPIPRMDSNQRKAIVSPAVGLMVFQTEGNLVYIYDGISWGFVAANRVQSLAIIGVNSIWNCNLGLNASINLTTNVILDLQNVIPGYVGFLVIKQDGTGNRTITLPAQSKVGGNGAGIITLSTAPNSIDILKFYYDGTNYYWNVNHSFN